MRAVAQESRKEPVVASRDEPKAPAALGTPTRAVAVGVGTWVILGLSMAAIAAGPRDQEPTDPRARSALAEARATAQELVADLKKLLGSELRGGGFEAAVRVCAQVAQEKTAKYRQASGYDVRRVSLRWRNPANEPDAYERAVLEAFGRLPAEERAGAEHWELVSEGGRVSLRYLKPLVATQLCLNCHGATETIPPKVTAALAERYPDDRAVGFGAGDVRGAVTIRVPLASKP